VSISAEWWAYFLFPFIVLCLQKRKWLTITCSVLFVLAAYLSIMYLLPRTNPLDPTSPVPHDLDATFDFGFLRGFAGFMTGIYYTSYINGRT
jgi:peptidoglycan/LPS O-acetylase OafA/YrhL